MKKVTDYFKGRTAVIGNKHSKEQVIAPILQKELGLKVIVPKEIDTDQFGTFTRDIPRKGSQLDAARAKAREGMRLTGADIGIASEGTFAPADFGFVTANTEIVVLLDSKNNLEYIGGKVSLKNNLAEEEVASFAEAIEFARKIGFPKHGIVVRKHNKDTKHLVKGIITEQVLEESVERILRLPFNKSAFLETDMRAHVNPTRMEVIRQATLDLVQNIKRHCPKCGSPGMKYVQKNPGLVCSMCSLKTDNTLSITYECQVCEHKVEEMYPNGKKAEPKNCQWCNP